MSIIVMSDDDFEKNMDFLASQFNPLLAASFHARDAAQREAIERLQGELDEYISSVPGIEYERDNLREALARVEAERDTAIVQIQNIRKERDRINKQLGDTGFNLCITQQQLAEAVGLLSDSECAHKHGWHETHAKEVALFLARHAQAEQQEAQGAQAGDEARKAAFENHWYAQKATAFGSTEAQRHFDAGWHARAALATQPAAGEPEATWVALTAAGQLRKGDKIRFRFGEETLTETVALVLDAGTEREEIVYNRKRNFYFITSKALAGTSSAKEVEVLRIVAAPPAAAPVAVDEPIQVEAVAITREDEDGLYLDWVLEGGISALEAPGVVLLVAHGTVTDDQGSGEVYLAPPAAAHGDEAVRKDAERLDFILMKCRKVVVEMLPRGRDVYVEEGVMGERTYPAIHRDKDWPAGSAEDFAIKRQAIDAAMYAQSDGEDKS